MLNCAAYKITIVDVSSQWETQGEWFCNEPSQRQNLKMSFLCKWWSLAHRYWERLRELGREAPAFDAFCHKTFSKRIQWKLSVVKGLNDLWIRLTLHFSVSLKVDFFYWCLVNGVANISAARLQWRCGIWEPFNPYWEQNLVRCQFA